MRKIISLIFCSAVSFTFLAADIRQGERIPIGTRPSSVKTNKEKPEAIQENAAEETPYQAGYNIDSLLLPHEYHRLTEKSHTDDQIEIEDGALFSNKTARPQWQPNDILIIHPNKDLFFNKDYKYKIYNIYKKDFTYANLSFGPFINSPETYFIIDIDFTHHLVYLGNQETTFTTKIHSWDDKKFQEWLPGDAIIIGLNNPTPSTWKHILINAQTNTYVRARIKAE